MKRTADGLLRIGFIIFLLRMMIYNLGSISDHFDSVNGTAEYIGTIIGAILTTYFIISFFIHYISQSIIDLKKGFPKRINYITISGFIFGIVLLGTYTYRIVTIVTS